MDAKLGKMEVNIKSKQQVKQELQDGRCSELEERDRKLGDWGLGLESKVQIAVSKDETLEVRYRTLEEEKLKIEHELELLKKENTELKEQISNLENERNESHEKKNRNEQILVDLTEPNEEEELAMVNTVLQIEKENAEKDAAMWKQKYEELLLKMNDEELLLKMDDKGRHKHEGVRLMVDLSSFSGPPNAGTPHLQNAGTPPSYESKQNYTNEAVNRFLEMEVHSNRRAKKQLLFEDNNKGIAPQTPCVSKRVGVIDISDSDEDADQGRGRTSEHDEKDGHEEMMISFTPTTKRKRPSNVVNSDSENDEDDDVPISTLKKLNRSESPKNDFENSQAPPVRRRIRTLREAGETSQGIPTIKDTDSDHSLSKDVGSESDSEGESLGGFIVHDDDDVEEDKDDGDINYKDIISMFQRSKDCKSGWELEGQMLAAFGKDPVLCMKAVCVIYRQQTADEKVSKEAIHINGRGFSKFDALSGCQMGEFLTGGDPKGDVKVSVEQLLQHDAMGVDLCRKFALHYSKQLFMIYQSREDPFFRCSETKE